MDARHVRCQHETRLNVNFFVLGRQVMETTLRFGWCPDASIHGIYYDVNLWLCTQKSILLHAQDWSLKEGTRPLKMFCCFILRIKDSWAWANNDNNCLHDETSANGEALHCEFKMLGVLLTCQYHESALESWQSEFNDLAHNNIALRHFITTSDAWVDTIILCKVAPHCSRKLSLLTVDECRSNTLQVRWQESCYL